MKPDRLREAFSVGLVLALVGTALWYGIRPTSVPSAFVGPSFEELDSLSRYLAPLSRYLAPVGPAPDVEDYEMFVPAGELVPTPLPGPAVTEAAPPATLPHRLTAILVVGDQPTAIIDDRQVWTGSVLPGGTEVVAIDRSQVVLRGPDGSRRTLRLSENEQLGL
jgi:hypothetical protein